MLRIKMPVADGIHPQSNKFATGVENEAMGDSKPNDSPELELWRSPNPDLHSCKPDQSEPTRIGVVNNYVIHIELS